MTRRLQSQRAIVTALLATAVLYMAVGFTGVALAGAGEFAALTHTTAAPLEAIAQQFGVPGGGLILAVGAVTAMLGVLLNLLLGLSRVLLAMGRRRDMPPVVATIDAATATPAVAVLIMGVVVGLLALVGSVKATWSFSAFTVLVYYAIANAAALRLPTERRLYPRWLAWAGLGACLFLAFWVEPVYWLAGLGMIALGLLVQQGMRRIGAKA